MEFRESTRGQALQVGAILLFGIAILGLTIVQSQVVPVENKQVEFQHSLTVQNDMSGLHTTVVEAGTSEGVHTAEITMGTTYPARILLVTPPPAQGTLRTDTPQTVRVANVTATSDESRDYLNGSYTLQTKSISYNPGYHVYQNAPTTTYQAGVLVNEHQNGNSTAVTEQTLVRQNEIYIVSVGGNVSRAQLRSASLSPQSVSISTDPTTVTNTSDGDVTVTVPSTLSEQQYVELLGPQYDPDGEAGNDSAYVSSVRKPGPERITLTFEPGVTYQLHTARVTVGPGTHTTDAAYLTRDTTQSDEDVVLEVRDGYNNPVPNADTNQNLTVNVSTGRGQVADSDGLKAVGEDGRVAFDVTVPSGAINLTLQHTSRSLSAANSSVNTSVAELGVESNGYTNDTGDEGESIDGTQSDCVTNVTTNSDGSNGILSFDITNGRSCDSLTVEKVGVAYDSNGGTEFGFVDQSLTNDEREAEIVISGSGEGSFDGDKSKNNGEGKGKGQTVSTDGSYNTLESFATIPAGGGSNVAIGYVTDDDGDSAGEFEYTDITTGESNRPTGTKYFTVKLNFGDGSVTKVYLDATTNT